MNKLTTKESSFLNYILEGKTQAEAYKLSYNCTGKDSSIRVRASNLFNKDKIQAEYKKALSSLQKESLYTREQAIKDLTYLIEKSKDDIAENGIKQANVLGLTKAIEQVSNIMCLSDIEVNKLKIEEEKLNIAKSKLKQDNDDLQKENASLLRKLVTGE